MDMEDGYPLVLTNIAVENCHLEWVFPWIAWWFSIAMLNYQRVSIINGVLVGYRWDDHVVGLEWDYNEYYPQVDIYTTMENDHFV